MSSYRVLTIKQPYAGLIVMGLKTLETRSWTTSYRGKLLIHASAKPDKPMLEKYLKERTPPFEVPKLVLINGTILGEVDLVDCFKQSALLEHVKNPNRVAREYSHWNMDHYAWKLENPRVLRDQDRIAIKGKLGIWKWEGEL